MTWRETHALLRGRADRAPQLVREAARLEIPDLPFAPRAVRSFVTTGVGSSAAAAKLLAHLLAVELGVPARFAPAGAFVAPPRDVERDVLIVFSTGLSPNARLALSAPHAWRSVVVAGAVDPRDAAAGAEKLDAIAALQRAGGLYLQLPGGTEYGALLRVAAPVAAYAAALRLAQAIGRAAAAPVDRLGLDVDAICHHMRVAAASAAALGAGDPFLGRVVFLASGGYGDLADNLPLKVQESLLAALPPVWDLVGFAHGPFQEVCAQDLTFLVLQRRGAPLEAELLARLHEMLDGGRQRLLALPAELPGPLALFEHETLMNELVLRGIAARQIDQARWPGRGRDRPLYDVSTPATEAGAAPAAARPVAAARALDALTWPRLEALIRGGCRTAVLPLGATEQHGPHLPLATDSWIAAALAERFCQRVEEAIHLPVMPIGCSSEHAEFPGTLSLQAATLRTVLQEMLAALARHGFETVFIFSAHGGNYAALRDALPALRDAARPARVIAFTDLDRAAAIWHAASAAAGVTPQAAGHHAGEFETSILLALHPDAVRRDQLAPGLVDTGRDPQAIFYPSLRAHSPSGVVGDPRGAAAARAERYLGAWVDALIECYRREKNATNTNGTQNA